MLGIFSVNIVYISLTDLPVTCECCVLDVRRVKVSVQGFGPCALWCVCVCVRVCVCMCARARSRHRIYALQVLCDVI